MRAITIAVTILTLFIAVGAYGQTRKTITIGVEESDYKHQEAFLFSDSTRLSKGDRYVQFKPLSGRSVIGEVDGDGKKYRDGWHSLKGGGVDIIRQKIAKGTKETIVVRDSTLRSFRYIVKSSDKFTKIGSDYVSALGKILAPVAWDADSNAVSSSFTLSGDTLTYFYTPDAGTVWPVYIDPTYKFNENDIFDAPMLQAAPTTNYESLNALYVRGDSAGSDVINDWIYVDMDSVSRADSVVSALLILTRYQNNATGDATGQVHLAKVGRPVEAQITWNIWKTSNNWNLAGARGGADIEYTTPAPISFTAENAIAGVIDTIDVTTLVRKVAGRDSSKAWHGFIIRSTSNNGNTAYYASSEHATAGYRPRLVITTETVVTLTCSTTYLSTYDSIRVHAGGDTSLVDSTRAYKIVGTDTLALTAWQVTPATTYFDSATGNQSYTIIVKGKTATNNYWSNKDTILTKPDTAGLSLSAATATTISVIPLNGTNNATNTKISIMDSSRARTKGHRLYLTTAGDTSTTERFYTAGTWGTVPAGGFTRGQWGIFAVRAQNNDSTYFSALKIDSVQISAQFDSFTVTSIDTNKIRVVTQADTFTMGDTIFIKVWNSATSDTVKRDTVEFTTNKQIDTFTVALLNTKYKTRAVIRDTNKVEYPSSVDSARTWAHQITSAAGTWVSDTSFTVVIVPHTSNPVNTGIWCIDSARTDSTNKYLHPDSLGFISTKRYASYTKWNAATLKILKGQRSIGQAIKIRFNAANVDSTGNQ